MAGTKREPMRRPKDIYFQHLPEKLTIAELSNLLELPTNTLRYWVQVALLVPTRSTPGKRLEFSHEQLAKAIVLRDALEPKKRWPVEEARAIFSSGWVDREWPLILTLLEIKLCEKLAVE